MPSWAPPTYTQDALKDSAQTLWAVRTFRYALASPLATLFLPYRLALFDTRRRPVHREIGSKIRKTAMRFFPSYWEAKTGGSFDKCPYIDQIPPAKSDRMIRQQLQMEHVVHFMRSGNKVLRRTEPCFCPSSSNDSERMVHNNPS